MDNVCGQKFLWKEADEKGWKKAVTLELANRQPAFTCLFRDTADTAELDGAAETLMDAMQEATKVAVPTRQQSLRARPWWNDDLKKTLHNLFSLHNEARIYYSVHHSTDADAICKIKCTRKNLQCQLQ